jgi:hypothetical protein
LLGRFFLSRLQIAEPIAAIVFTFFSLYSAYKKYIYIYIYIWALHKRTATAGGHREKGQYFFVPGRSHRWAQETSVSYFYFRWCVGVLPKTSTTQKKIDNRKKRRDGRDKATNKRKRAGARDKKGKRILRAPAKKRRKIATGPAPSLSVRALYFRRLGAGRKFLQSRKSDDLAPRVSRGRLKLALALANTACVPPQKDLALLYAGKYRF